MPFECLQSSHLSRTEPRRIAEITVRQPPLSIYSSDSELAEVSKYRRTVSVCAPEAEELQSADASTTHA